MSYDWAMQEFPYQDDYDEFRGEDEVYSVSKLNGEAKYLLESNFPSIWVEGEISNLARPSSGHIYFSLKDDSAQVRCAMFRGSNRLLPFTPDHGMQVKVRAKVSLYPGRGDFQLIVDRMEEAGAGLLQQAYERLKQKLHAEGLFEPKHKQEWPEIPKLIGIITSPTGAAIRDILSVLKRRYPMAPVIIYPVAVQGENAGKQIADALKLADQRNECDVLIISRGGGSLEDLWAFNEELVARAIFDCSIPLISGVGHEVDFTIADFVADHRAPTPSAAAELITPDQGALLQQLTLSEQSLHDEIKTLLEQRQQQIDWLEGRLAQRHPGQWLALQQQRLSELKQRMINSQKNSSRYLTERVASLSKRVQQQNPQHRIDNISKQLGSFYNRLELASSQQLKAAKVRLQHVSHTLDTVSPLATLSRGYAIVTSKDSNKVISDASTANEGTEVEAKLNKGTLHCRVIKST